MMGGNYEMKIGGLRVHENGGNIHIHDDSNNIKFSMPVSDFKTKFEACKANFLSLKADDLRIADDQGVELRGAVTMAAGTKKMSWTLCRRRIDHSGFDQFEDFLNKV